MARSAVTGAVCR